jgi:hypothetical protein
MIIKAGGHLALSIEEQIANEKAAMADMNAKLLIGTIRSWAKVKQNPEMKETARVALTFRMTSLAKRKIQYDTGDEDEPEVKNEGGSAAEPAS